MQLSQELHENQIGGIVIEKAIQLHRDLGPGLLETVYKVLLAHSLEESGIKVQRQVIIPVQYHNIKFDEGFRADLRIQNKVILELKSIERINLFTKNNFSPT